MLRTGPCTRSPIPLIDYAVQGICCQGNSREGVNVPLRGFDARRRVRRSSVPCCLRARQGTQAEDDMARTARCKRKSLFVEERRLERTKKMLAVPMDTEVVRLS